MLLDLTDDYNNLKKLCDDRRMICDGICPVCGHAHVHTRAVLRHLRASEDKAHEDWNNLYLKKYPHA